MLWWHGEFLFLRTISISYFIRSNIQFTYENEGIDLQVHGEPGGVLHRQEIAWSARNLNPCHVEKQSSLSEKYQYTSLVLQNSLIVQVEHLQCGCP